MHLDEIKKIEVEILEYVKKVCEKNNLRYFLAGGTLLGSIRHKGFIPWDDDIDIIMPRPDYMKFLKLLENNEKYNILTPYNEKNYYYFFTKLADKRTLLIENNHFDKLDKLGVCIDIFPVDGLPEDYDEQKKYIKKLFNEYKKYQNSKFNWYCLSNNKIKKYAKMILKFPYFLYCKSVNRKKRILNLMEKYDYEKSKYIAYLLSAYKEKEIVKKSIYDKSINVQFEGNTYPVAIGYIEYLTNMYGDYMKLPKAEKRVSHHNYEAYWR